MEPQIQTPNDILDLLEKTMSISLDELEASMKVTKKSSYKWPQRTVEEQELFELARNIGELQQNYEIRNYAFGTSEIRKIESRKLFQKIINHPKYNSDMPYSFGNPTIKFKIKSEWRDLPHKRIHTLKFKKITEQMIHYWLYKEDGTEKKQQEIPSTEV